MAEALGIAAAALAFAQAAVAVLDEINKVKDAPKNAAELKHELEDLTGVLNQISHRSYKKGDPTEAALRRCQAILEQVQDLVAPFAQGEGNRIKQYAKGLLMRPKESEIETAVKRLQSCKLTLALALITHINQAPGVILSGPSIGHRQHDMPPLYDQLMPRETKESGASGLDMSMLTRIIDERMTAATQQLYHEPASKVEELLNLDRSQTNELWRLDFKSVRRLKEVANEMKLEQFLESLNTPDYEKDRVRIKDTSTGTCEWIWDQPEYQSHRTSNKSCILHVLGKAGSGKSVLAKYVWKRLSKELADSPGSDSYTLLYYSCNQRTRPGESASSVLRALIHQILRGKPSLFTKILLRNELMQSHSFAETFATWTLDILWSIFKAIVVSSQLQIVYCIIDGLDESENESMDQLLFLIPELLDQDTNGVKVKFFLTSRDEGHITESLEGHTATIHIDSINHNDIEKFVNERVDEFKRKLKLKAEADNNLRQILVQRSQGMFLWVELALNDLKKAHRLTANTLISRVQSLPFGLNAFYERMLTKIEELCKGDEETIVLVRRMLTWLALAARPLTLAELRIALAIEPDTRDLSSVDPLQNISRELRNLCGSFVEIGQINNETSQVDGGPLSKSQTEDWESDDLSTPVRLIHQSAKEYLISSTGLNAPFSKFQIDSQAGNSEIARVCLTYLQCTDFESGPIKEVAANNIDADIDGASLLKQKLASYEFLDYSALHWPSHVQEAPSVGEGADAPMHACKFLKDFPEQFQSWYQISFFLRNLKVKYNPGFTGVHAAAWWGLNRTLELLLDRGCEIETKDNDGWTALHYASQNGHLEVVKLLLDQGCEIEAKSNGNWTALHVSSINGHLEVVKLLLDRGCEIEAKDTENWTALHDASRNGHLEVVKLLLDRGCEIEAKDNDDWTALHYASQNGHLEVVKLLLNRGCDIEAKDNDNWTALHIASQNGYLEVVKLLLDRGCEIEAKDKDNWTALHEASQNGHLEVVKLLLDRGCEIETKDSKDWTSLHTASQKGHLEVVKLLLNRGCDIEAKDDENWTALHTASLNGHLEVVKLLLDRGCEIEAKNKRNWTALHTASLNGHLEVVKLLLDRESEIEAKDKNNWTALHTASRNGHQEVVNLLLDRECDIEAKDKNNLTALHTASYNGHLEVVKLLLNRGCEIEAKDSNDWTALHTVSLNGHLEVVKLLLDRGCEIEAKGNGNWTALHNASQNGHLEVVKLLLDRGCEIEAKDSNNWTALHTASQNGHFGIVERLLEEGAQIDLEGKEFGMILQAAADNGKEKLVQLLVGKRIGNNDVYSDALQFACMKGHTAIANCLIGAGADPKKMDEHGWIPLQCALHCQQKAILEQLDAAGGDLDAAAQSTALPPTSWSTADKSMRVLLEDNGMSIRYCGTDDKEENKLAVVRSNHPIPLGRNDFHIEITVVEAGDTGEIALGICSEYTFLDAWPGHTAASWAYHGDVGKFYASADNGSDYSDTFGAGDVIGCHFSFNEGISFTKNGASLGNAISGISGKLYPVVGMRSRGAYIRTNFGRG